MKELLNGLVIGLAAGLSPGPLMTLIIGESLRGGWPAGFAVSLAPLITDSTFIAIALLVAAPMPPWALALISIIGGVLIMWLGWGTARATAPGGEQAVAVTGGSVWKGVVTNLLNAQAFIFWVTAGGSILTDAYRSAGLPGPLRFMSGFFGVMIGVNLLIAFGVSRSRRFLQGQGYLWALRIAGTMVMLLGAWRLWDGVQRLGG